jgi:hypothetical protein
VADQSYRPDSKIVTTLSTGCKRRGITGDTDGLFWLVRLFRRLLQDNGIQPSSDWGSSGRSRPRPGHRDAASHQPKLAASRFR